MPAVGADHVALAVVETEAAESLEKGSTRSLMLIGMRGTKYLKPVGVRRGGLGGRLGRCFIKAQSRIEAAFSILASQ